MAPLLVKTKSMRPISIICIQQATGAAVSSHNHNVLPTPTMHGQHKTNEQHNLSYKLYKVGIKTSGVDRLQTMAGGGLGTIHSALCRSTSYCL